ncbi:MAG: DUF2336 domain-containing protein [Alphaproteobacteria bacterium]|jgi:uncharacterized protein (DUF2336 family)|nr:DUF2336 domain-containing protein [Alphaproteobacteria bacterium]MBT7943301.1 DUF2336 domain-containing protein [Alphaproteobacteria bacterium]
MAQIDGEYLLSLARDKSGKRRQVLAETISDLFTGKDRVLNERERALMFEILHKMVHNAEMGVRRIIADQLSVLPDAPSDLITLLANDDIEVAYSILHDSAILEDEDLIEVIRHRTQEHNLAIAVRSSVSENVTDVLVETGDESVITTLLKNSGSSISLTTMEFLVEESQRVDAYQEPILSRDDLDPTLAKRMYLWVTAALRKFILDNFDFDKTVLDDMLEQSSKNPAPKTKTKSDELAEDIEHEGLGLANMMIRALQDGEVFLFEAMFRRMTGLRNTLVKRIMFEPGGEGLAIACKATGISIKDFTTIYSLSRLSQTSSDGLNSAETQRILDFYDSLPEKSAKEALSSWRRNADYLKAIRELNIGP